MTRHTKKTKCKPEPPLGVTSAFSPFKYALPLTNQKFAYMDNCIGFYLNPYLGK